MESSVSHHTTAVIPLRGLHGGKSRLSPVLDPAQRSAIIARMAEHVVGAVLESNVADSIVIVSREHDVFDRIQVRHPQVSLVTQAHDSIGLNSAVDDGRTVAIERYSDLLLVLSADLPVLDAADLVAMGERAQDVVIAPDRFGVGTNALMLRGQPAISQFRFHFGPASRRLHEVEALRLGIETFIHDAASIALDLDTPADWDMLAPCLQNRLLSPQVSSRESTIGAAAMDAVALLERS